ARMQARAADDLKRLVTEGLEKAGLAFESAEAYSTPRRLALVVEGIPERQPDLKEERKGPRVGAPDQAIQGFLKSAGLPSLDACETREIKGNAFWFAVTERKGQAAAAVLPAVVGDAINGLGWPKSMRWGTAGFRWVRPLQNIIGLFAGELLPGGVSLREDTAAKDGGEGDGLPYSAATRGHRFLSDGMIPVDGFADYREKLTQAFVVLDAGDRRDTIRSDAEALASQAGFTLRDDPALVDEVAGLVEWPVVLMGDIDPEFMAVPPEVLVTAMRTHQKYFALEDANGDLAPHFIVVANIESSDKGKAIVAGNERVLRARLSDAKFFWDQDRKMPLAQRAPDLEQIVFHARLGTLDQKVDRIEALAAALAPLVGADRDRARSGARLAKADLTTGMVGEFPELQGIMGRYYALHDDESPDVADAIAEHYAPQGPKDRCPTAPVSVAVALADKMDTLAGFWAIGEKPTGSRDPYALRRAALGIIRLVIENELRLPLIPLLNEAAHMVINQQLFDSVMERRAAMDQLGLDEHLAVETMEVEIEEHPAHGEVYAIVFELLAFFADRLKVHLREQGVRHDQIDAVFAVGGEDDILRLLARVDALSAFLESDDGENLLAAYRRASNIVRIEEKKDEASHDGAPDPRLFDQPEEAALYDALGAASRAATEAAAKEKFGDAMAALAGLRAPTDAFFEAVKVNAEDAGLRANRLRLLSQIRTTMDRVADFSKIGG
ncbi:MAG: glycine--tRNA ligase subunit beta, partial [Bauldia litoralis]